MQEGTTPIPSAVITPTVKTGNVPTQYENVVFKRKFRWTFEAEFPYGKIPVSFVKVTARPTLEIEEVSLLDVKYPVLGKQQWSEIGVTYLNVSEKHTKELFEVLGKMYELWDLSKADINKPIEPEQKYLGKGEYEAVQRRRRNDGGVGTARHVVRLGQLRRIGLLQRRRSGHGSAYQVQERQV
jgi:hypothetical protein